MQIDRLLHHCDTAAAIPPVEQWHPPLLGDMPLVIKADGLSQRYHRFPFLLQSIPCLLIHTVI